METHKESSTQAPVIGNAWQQHCWHTKRTYVQVWLWPVQSGWVQPEGVSACAEQSPRTSSQQSTLGHWMRCPSTRTHTHTHTSTSTSTSQHQPRRQEGWGHEVPEAVGTDLTVTGTGACQGGMAAGARELTELGKEARPNTTCEPHSAARHTQHSTELHCKASRQVNNARQHREGSPAPCCWACQLPPHVAGCSM